MQGQFSLSHSHNPSQSVTLQGVNAVDVPEALYAEFALATDEEILELESATAKLRAKGLESDAIVSRLVKAGWSQAAATWYAGEVAKADGPVKIVIPGRQHFADYPRQDAPDPNSPVGGIRIAAAIDLLIGLLVGVSVPGLILMERRFESEGFRLYSAFVLIRQSFLAILLLGTGFLLLKVGPRSVPSWLRALLAIEWLNLATALYGFYLIGVSVIRRGFFQPNFDDVVYLAFAVSWFAARGLRLYCISVARGE